jgi:hypothetical protein
MKTKPLDAATPTNKDKEEKQQQRKAKYRCPPDFLGVSALRGFILFKEINT